MSKYKVNKIGFINFWLYDEEEFYFYDGKLLLRGTNGSGKTVTMQSFFPLIFDGNKSPERLDPFGSRDRKIEDYLLPEDFSGNENTGYLYMEFFDKEENKYLTIGIGLRAIKNRNCEFWGFSITDNRRIGTDLLLFKERNLRIPLTKKELQTRIGTGGELVETAKEYKKMVNKLLFGFKSIDLYTEFINLLIQVRSPKLSNSTRPSQLTKILSTVLEPLNEDEIRDMAESIEDMNKYKEKINDLQNEQKACNNLKNAYYEYNKSILYKKGETFLKYKQEKTEIQKSIKEKNLEIEKLLDEITRETSNLENLKLEEEQLEHRKKKLEETDLKSISNQLEEIIHFIKELENEKIKKVADYDKKENILVQNKKELKKKEDELYKLEASFDELLTDLTSYEEDINFDDAKFYLDDIKKERLAFNQMQSYLNTIKKQVTLLTRLKDLAYKVYQKTEEIETEKNKYEQSNDNLKKLKNKHTEISNKLLDSMDNFKQIIAKTSSGNQILKIDENRLEEIYKIIDDLQRDLFIKIKSILKEQVYEKQDILKLNISNNAIKINEYHKKIETLKQDLKDLNNILINRLDDIDTKDYFEKNNIPYKYFFETIEFREIVSEEKRKQIESFLLETGILTSFITNQNIKNSIVKTKCLKAGKIQNKNLTEYLVPLKNEYETKVLDILKSISISSNDSQINILDNGNYEFVLIEGSVNSNHNLRYIGEITRKKYIENEREKIDISINQFTKEIKLLEEKNNNLNKDINILNEEINNFEYPEEIMENFKQLDKINQEIEFMNENLSNLLEIVKNKTSELRLLEEDLDINKKGYYGSIKYLDLKQVLEFTNNYFELVKELSSVFNEYFSKEELVQNYKLTIENNEEDLTDIKLEINKINYDLNDYNNKKKNIDDILNSDKYKDVGREYKKITERLSIIKEDIPIKRDIVTRNQTNLEHFQKDIFELDIKLNNINTLTKVTYKIFMDEYNLHYIDTKDLQENELYQFIKSIKTNNNITEVSDKFSDSAIKYTQVLINYAPKNITLHLQKENDYLNYTNDESQENIINELLESAKRRDLVFNYLGKNVNLLELTSAIELSISNYENLISEENRRLFEDLLINNIGSSIRNKIYQSEEWIEIVKEKMESMKTSSGLSFSLKWKGIEALNEDEIDTKEIVNIFKKDADSLKPEHLSKITNHFKSKIKMKEESLEESERNYLEIIKEVLDYRKWFEFKLYFKRGENDKKELTDREFNKMSGGEKAIAMYIPLFSSIYAKLNSAYPNAPHVIALDEAFAGVDDENIKDAFRILSEFDIDYVLTSQQLWGDYETVKHLAISELHHPIGSKVVSVMKYKWDGISRSKVDDNKQYQH